MLYKRGGFTPDEIAKLREHTHGDVVRRDLLSGHRRTTPSRTDAGAGRITATQIFSQAPGGRSDRPPAEPPRRQRRAPPPGAAARPPRGGRRPADGTPAAGAGPGDHDGPAGLALPGPRRLDDDRATRYVFDTRPLTNDRPYFAAYVKPGDLPKIIDRLELLQDEWGYLLLWATLAIAAICAVRRWCCSR